MSNRAEGAADTRTSAFSPHQDDRSEEPPHFT